MLGKKRNYDDLESGSARRGITAFGIPLGRFMLGVGAIVILFVALIGAGSIVENLDNADIMVIQDPIDGELHVYTSPGLKLQKWGKVTKYTKSFPFWFSAQHDQGETVDQSISTRFNDGGHAKVSGYARVQLPLDEKNILKIHTKYASQDAVEQQLIRTTFEKAIYMSGPLMSSKESYSDRRNELISVIEDQALHGIYRTKSTEAKIVDPLSGKEKTATIVKILQDDNGNTLRQEKSPFDEYGVTVIGGISINKLEYDAKVEKQIQAQQDAIMEVQTAIAKAKMSEQEAIRAEKQGQADYQKAKWAQEEINAKEIAEGEKELKLASLRKAAAAEYKQEMILKGQGEAEYKELVMKADGALAQKIEAYKYVADRYATEFGKQKWVPEIQMGASGTGENNGALNAMTMIDLLMVKTAKDLKLDMDMKAK